MPTAWVTEPPGSSANTSGVGSDVTSPPEPDPTAAAAATASATAMTSFETINAQSSSSKRRAAPLVAGHSPALKCPEILTRDAGQGVHTWHP